MEPLKKLSTSLQNRLVELYDAKEKGYKVVGYTPGGYFPEELALASEAVPVGLIRGGDHFAVELAGSYICRWIDTFCRAQIGYATSSEDPYYKALDLLVIPVTDNHIRAISDVLDYYTDLEVFPFGVPHMKDTVTTTYYLQGLMALKSRLEELTGVEITVSRLQKAISLCNREKEALRKIGLMRRSGFPITSKDFVALNHGSFLLDKRAMVEILEEMYEVIKEGPSLSLRGPRIMLTGPTLALGDGKILDIINDAGGQVVVEEFAECMKPYWQSVSTEGDLLENLADCYFQKRIPPAWFRPDRERLDFLIHLARDFDVDGVIWYQLMYRESYKIESYYFGDLLKRETGLPMLVVESDYDAGEIGQLRTRVETFLDTIRR